VSLPGGGAEHLRSYAWCVVRGGSITAKLHSIVLPVPTHNAQRITHHSSTSHAAPRTPLESPCLFGTSRVATESLKTYSPHLFGTSS